MSKFVDDQGSEVAQDGEAAAIARRPWHAPRIITSVVRRETSGTYPNDIHMERHTTTSTNLS